MRKKQQQRIMQNLAHFARNEEAGLKKVRVMKTISQIAGWVCLLIAFSLAFQESAAFSPWIHTFIAAFGGALIGIGVWFENTLVTWPILRQFIDLTRMQNAADN